MSSTMRILGAASWLAVAAVLPACRPDPPSAAAYVATGETEDPSSSGEPVTEEHTTSGGTGGTGAATGSMSTGPEARCGDGVVSPGEECDDEGPSATCDVDCTLAECGDGVVNTMAGESCDDGGPSESCDENCARIGCGDGVVDTRAGEECDDVVETARCDSDCTAVVCGDGLTNTTAGEDCDDAGESATCDADCTLATCGDGQVNVSAAETCDEGGESATCDADCTAAMCGDAVFNAMAGEQCDEGMPTAACDADCTLAACGDGSVNMAAGEACDDMGESATCNADCSIAACGDGITNVTAGEACDDMGESAACNANCTATSCGDGILNVTAGEACDDAGPSPTCDPDCTLAQCGDALLNSVAGEQCDGPELGGATCVSEGFGGGTLACDPVCSYDTSGCYECGNGMLDPGEECDDGNVAPDDGCLADCTVPTSCAQILAFDAAATDGAYIIDPDGNAGIAPFGVYCNMTLDGGGWQLISVRYTDSGVLFADATCTDIAANCSGTIIDEQLMVGNAPDLLFATTNGQYWLHVTGLAPPGSDALLDVITRDRILTETADCTGDQYCDQNLDAGLMVLDSSPNFVPRFVTLSSQFVRVGGVWLGFDGGSADDHVVSMNYSDYCSPTGLQLSDNSSGALGNVTCSEPGALYFRY